MHGMEANPSAIQPFPLNIDAWVNVTRRQPHLAEKKPNSQPKVHVCQFFIASQVSIKPRTYNLCSDTNCNTPNPYYLICQHKSWKLE